eukprot:PhM_4_TR7719/c0_g1_i1/m.89918/K10416/DYNC1LI, DNCLI; dynein light intermediate chain 1, cytosolic
MSMWESLVQEFSSSSSLSVDCKRVIVLGEAQDGKRTLLGRFKNNKDTKELPEFFGMGYSYVDLSGKMAAASASAASTSTTDDDEVTRGRVEFVAISGGDHAQLLQLALPDASHLPHTHAMIVVDLSRPWSVLDTINNWVDMLHTHIQSIVKTPEDEDVVASCRKAFNTYISDFNRSGMNVVMPGSPRLKASNKTLSEFERPSSTETEFIGVPLFIVGTKVDMMDRALSADASRTPQQTLHASNFVQGHVRRLALKYAASVAFTSSLPSRPTNCRALLDYIGHRVLGFTLPESATTLTATQECFVPAGTDSAELLSMLTVQHAMPTSSQDAVGDITLDVPFDKVIQAEIDVTNIEPPIDVAPIEHNQWLKQKKDLLSGASSSSGGAVDGTGRLSAASPSRGTRAVGGDYRPGGGSSSSASSEPIEKKAELFFASMSKQHRQK